MHEMSIAMSLIELACEEAARLDGARVLALHVRVGTRAAVVADALRFSFDLAAQGTPIEGARLDIEEVPGLDLQLSALEVSDDAAANC